MGAELKGTMNHSLRARLMLSASMAIFGTLSVFVRNIPLASGELALYRAALAALLIGGYLLLTRQKLDLAGIRRELLLLLLSGVAMGFNWILLFQAYRYTTVSVATLSYYFAPVIVTVLSPVLFHEKLSRRQIVRFVMSMVGLVLVIGVTDLARGGSHFTGILFGLGAAVLYATVILLNKSIRNISGIHRTFLKSLAAILVLIPYVACTGGFHLAGMPALGWGCLLVVGLFHTGVTYCMYFSALKELSGQEASILSYIDPLVAVVISVLVLHEPIPASQLAGGILILGFTLWNERASA